MSMDSRWRTGTVAGGNGIIVLLCVCWLLGCAGQGVQGSDAVSSHLKRTQVFLAAGDYRSAIEACQQEVSERPSASSYIALTYVYQALDAYLESLTQADQWVAVELLAQSLSPGRPEDLLDAPDILARIAKELIQASARRQADIAAAQAARLDKQTVATLWQQQTAWRARHRENWWFGVPKEWGW